MHVFEFWPKNDVMNSKKNHIIHIGLINSQILLLPLRTVMYFSGALEHS